MTLVFHAFCFLSLVNYSVIHSLHLFSYYVISFIFHIHSQELSTEDSTFPLYDQLSMASPLLLQQPLVHEQDRYFLHLYVHIPKILCSSATKACNCPCTNWRTVVIVQYLAWSLKQNKAVNYSKRVVRVIKKGHANGVIYALVDQGDLMV